mgnify:CR=1 FL=1
MNEENTTHGESSEHDLRIVTARLADLQRKCRSVGSRNQEASEMEERIESILVRLDSADDTDADPIPFASLARELFAVERFFESNGFLSVAKEVAHVERTLEGFAPRDEPAVVGPSVEPSDLEPESSTDQAVAEIENTTDAAVVPSRWSIPRPLAVVMVFFVAALAVCVVIIVRHRPLDVPVMSAALEPTPAPIRRPPTPSSVATTAPGALATPAPGAILAEAVGKARLALAEGDVDTAIDHLSRAALVDIDHATVLGTANQIVDLLIDRAEQAVDTGLWEIADLTLARAGRIANRFGLDTHRITRAAHRYSQMARFKLIKPDDTNAIRASTGKRVTILLKDQSSHEGIINGVKSGQLLLDQDTTVRGGAMYYVEKVPLRDIDFLKVWDD